MAIDATSSGTSASSASSSSTKSTDSTMSAFRQADFLKIMLSEVTNQNPLEPQDTDKLVQNMKQLQDLANSTYTKFRGDINWAQGLMNKSIQVQQQALDPKEVEALKNKGLTPDVGYGAVTGTVESFRVVDQQVYVSVKGKDYPIDNIKQIVPSTQNASYLSQVADQMLGKTVSWKDPSGAAKSGQVTGVAFDQNNDLVLNSGSDSFAYTSITRIGTAAAATTP